jgi:hypothetical protein
VGGFLRFVAFFALLFAGFVLVVLPLLMGPLLTGVVRDMGVHADSVNVSVALLDPSLILGRSRQVTLSATKVDAAPAQIGSLTLSLGNVNFFDRTFDTVNGSLNDVSLTLGGATVAAESATVAGPANAATVTATFAASQVVQLLTVVAAHNGLKLDNVAVSDSGVAVAVHGVTAAAQLSVKGGALLLDPGTGQTVVLLQPTKGDTWSLTDVWFTPSGMNLSGTVDVDQIVHDLSNASGPG